MGAFIIAIMRAAVSSLLIIEMRDFMLDKLKKLWALVSALLARFPNSAIVLATLAANFIARYGFHVSATQLLAIASAVVTVISVLTHGAIRHQAALARKGGKNA